MRRAELMRRSVRSPKCDRDIELAARHHEHVGRVVDHLVERDERKAKRHELNDRPQADHRRANAESGKTILADRRVDNAFGTEAFK